VVYDPDDPLGHLYDVDDGENPFAGMFSPVFINAVLPESTVITLGDWNHLPAEVAFANKGILAPYVDL
jgi:hypothetical protein